jgi:hypothetical protein
VNATTSLQEPPLRARIPADLNTPDRLVAGLSAHQLLILAGAAVPLYALWQALSQRVPLAVLAGLIAPLAAMAVAVALGRRDGLSLDVWLGAALTHWLRPRRWAPIPESGPPAPPVWEPPPPGPRREHPPAGLRLPATAIGSDGVISTGVGTGAALVAAGTVTTGLHTAREQSMLLAGYARWLNCLTGPVQVVVSARRVDLGARALHIAETAEQLGHPALAGAAIEHAEHLLDLAEAGEPLTRTVTIVCTATTSTGPLQTPGRDRERAAGTGSGAGAEAVRRAARTAAALSVLGSECCVLDGPEVTALLSAAVDPWGPGGPDWVRTPPGATVTARSGLVSQEVTDGQDETFEPDGCNDEGVARETTRDEARANLGSNPRRIRRSR